MTITSKRGRPEPVPPTPQREAAESGFPRIIIRPDGSWAFPDADGNPMGISPNDEEVLKKTTKGLVDINYIQMEDC